MIKLQIYMTFPDNKYSQDAVIEVPDDFSNWTLNNKLLFIGNINKIVDIKHGIVYNPVNITSIRLGQEILPDEFL